MERIASLVQDRAYVRITIALALSMLLASLGTSIANVALPALAEAFAAPFAQAQTVVIAYLTALTISVLIAGPLGDRQGLKPILLMGLGVFAVASLLCATTPHLWLLVIFRTLQGIGAGILMTLSMALMRQTASETRVGQAMGLLGTVSAFGTALGPSLGGILLPLTGWRGLFWIQVPLAAVALLLAFVALSDPPRPSGSLSTSLWSALHRGLVPHLLVNLLVAAVMMTTLVVGPFFLSLGLGLKATAVGFIMAVGPLLSIISGVPTGRLVDARGSHRVLVSGLVLLTTGALLMSTLPNLLGATGYVLALVVLTPGYQLFQVANNTAVLRDISKERQGTVAGVLSLSRNIGLVTGASVMSTIFAVGIGTKEVAQASPMRIGAGLQLTFLVAGGMMVVAMLITLGDRLRWRRRAS